MTTMPVWWETGTLKDLCLPITKSDPVDTGRESVRYIDIGTVDGSRHALLEVLDIPSTGAPSRCRQIVQSGDTVFSTVRPYLEKIAYVDDSLDGEFASTGFCVLRPGPRLEPKFLYYFSISRHMLDQVLPFQKGVSYPAVLDKEVRATNVPVPPLHEQCRIVGLLEHHFSRLDAAETSVRDGLQRTATLRKVHLRGTFDEEAAEMRPLLDVASIANGQTPKGLADVLMSGPGDDAVPFFKVGDMNAADGRWMNDARFFVSRESAERLGLHVRPAGTVLIPKRGGAIATNKKRILKSAAAYDLNTMGLVPNESLDSSYLWQWLQTVDLGRIADGSNVPQINATQIRELRLPVPNLQTQVAAARRLDEIDESLSRLAVELESVRLRARGLRRALLSAAFSGRLTGDASAQSVAEEMINA